MTWPFSTFSPTLTIGFWFWQVRSLRPTNFRSVMHVRADLDAVGIDVRDRALVAGADDHARVLGDVASPCPCRRSAAR